MFRFKGNLGYVTFRLMDYFIGHRNIHGIDLFKIG